jgi:uncharacterized protein (DUF433 family)
MLDSTIQAITYIVTTPGHLGGKPHIAQRRIGVHDIVIAHLHLGESIEEVASNYELRLAEVYAALSYYYDHQAQIDAIIAQLEATERRLKPPEVELAARRAALEARYPSLANLLQHHDPDRDMTPPAIAAEFGVSEQAIREAAAKGWIPARKEGKVWLIRRQDALARWQKQA